MLCMSNAFVISAKKFKSTKETKDKKCVRKESHTVIIFKVLRFRLTCCRHRQSRKKKYPTGGHLVCRFRTYAPNNISFFFLFSIFHRFFFLLLLFFLWSGYVLLTVDVIRCCLARTTAIAVDRAFVLDYCAGFWRDEGMCWWLMML